jgi:hypothetical protein
LSVRLDENLVAAAKRATGVRSDARLIEVALASLVVGEDFGEWLAVQGRRLRADLAIDF